MSETVEAPARITLGNYVGGEWRDARSGETYEKRNPMRPDEIVAEVPACDDRDVDAAVAAASEAFAGWAATPAPQRGNLLIKAAEVIDKRVEHIANEMTREMGKPLREARMETAPSASSGSGTVQVLSVRTPIGSPGPTVRRPPASFRKSSGRSAS